MADTALTMPRAMLGAGPLRMAGDDRLADLAAAGDERAFSVIFERHHQAIYRYCRSILGNDEDASDALQNTMLRALRALPGEKRTIALKPWLFRIAHNEAITLVRRRRPQADVDDEALGLQSVGPEVDSDTRERVQRLFEDLRELPERQRSALIMRELSGLSYDEIAAALHTSTGAATQAVFGARKALHEFAEGRDTRCDDIRREISRRDGRILASRRIRSHLRTCEDCTAFRATLAERERHLAVMAPPIPAIAAAAMLQGLQGGGGIGGGLSGLTGAAGSSHALVSAAALKATPMILAAAIGASTGAILAEPDATHVTPRDEPVAALRALVERAGDRAYAVAVAAAQGTRLRATPRVPDATAAPNAAPPAPGDDGAPSAPGPQSQSPAPATGTPTEPAPRETGREPQPQAEKPPAPKPTPTSAPKPTPTAPPVSAPQPAPAPSAQPQPQSPPPNGDENGGAVDEPTGPVGDEPGKPRKPRPCRPKPPPRGHPEGPCPS